MRGIERGRCDGGTRACGGVYSGRVATRGECPVGTGILCGVPCASAPSDTVRLCRDVDGGGGGGGGMSTWSGTLAGGGGGGCESARLIARTCRGCARFTGEPGAGECSGTPSPSVLGVVCGVRNGVMCGDVRRESACVSSPSAENERPCAGVSGDAGGRRGGRRAGELVWRWAWGWAWVGPWA